MNKEKRCPECGGHDFVEDRSAGDVVCKGCGLVVEAHVMDERSEWRTFSDKDKDSVDPNRVGGPSNPFLSDGGLSTVIGKAPGDTGASFSLSRLHARSNNPDRNFMRASKQIDQLCESLSLVSRIKDRACEYYKKTSDSKALRGRGMAPICAACLYLAARFEGRPLTFKEIVAMIPGLSTRDTGRCYKEIVNMMKLEIFEKDSQATPEEIQSKTGTALAPVSEQYMKRFCSMLKLDYETTKVCLHVAEASHAGHNSWHGKQPQSITAAIIWIVSQLHKNPDMRLSMQNVVTVANVAEVTLKARVKDMLPEMGRMLPSNFGKQEELERLMNAVFQGPRETAANTQA